jgi:exodeoxyribonuclease VII small subunit
MTTPRKSRSRPESKPESEAELSFEEALSRLERIVDDLETGEPELTAALAKFEAGVKLLTRCHGVLDQAERSVAILTGVDDEGLPQTAPFNSAATNLPDPSASDVSA